MVGRRSMGLRPAVWMAGVSLALAGLCGAGPAGADSGPRSLPPAGDGVTRVGLLGGLRQFNPAPALFRYVEAEPDLCLWLGDNVYADTKDDPGFIEACYAALAARPAFQVLRETVPYAAVWDDHDYGYNNSGKDYPLKRESRAIFRAFWGLESEIPESRDGVHYAKTFELDGYALHLILLDVRTHRDEPGGDADMLGEAQWAWLEEQLKTPADLTFIVSGTQFLLDKESGSETWDQYPVAWQRMTGLVRRSRVERLVFITGDQHYAEVCRARGLLDYDLVEFEFCGINQIEDPEFNPARASTVAESRHSCVFLDIQWEADEFDVPHLLFQVYDALELRPEVLYRVNLDELELDIAFDGPGEFVDAATLAVTHGYPNLILRYTTDGSEPTASSPRFVEPLTVTETTTVKAVLFDPEGWPRGGVRAMTLEKVAPVPPVDAVNTEKGLRVTSYLGQFEWMPDFGTLEPVAQDIARDFDVEAYAPREDHYALLFEGYLDVPADGMYRFETESDDGSRLLVRGRLLIDNDGSHSTRTRSGRIALAAGLHPIRIEYFEDHMGQDLAVRWYGPGGAQGAIPFERLRHAVH